MNSIADNARRVREKIDAAARSCGRKAEDIHLIAVSKNHGAEAVRAAGEAAGIFAFGENRAQEMAEKKAAGAYGSHSLHFIGHLQRNKVKMVVGEADLIQSAGSAALIRDIAARARALGTVQDVLIEVNIGREPQKSGVLPEALEEMIGLAAKEAGVRVRGLMAIPPFGVEIEETRKYFSKMMQLFVDITPKTYDNIAMEFLSMGMSGDFEDAVRAGANMVRVGQSIFGPRGA
ncbi:YggS family pyridoxal phosphate-dependent enzyme [Oscillospiraceae bacterium OttesenSCG-928-F05]|nr:YggS family pyridoxal phosphate-dependent enzyme [Oscillospiraceae bacterium OttesenSCG-928-F05]